VIPPRRAVSLLLLALGCAPLGGTLAAAPTETRAHWSVSLIGLPLARADLTLTLDGDHYGARLTWRTVGAVGILTGAHGEIHSEGRLADRRIDPAHYALSSGGTRRPSKVDLVFRDHRVVAAEVEPPSRPKPDLVPLGDEHRTGVVDPLSAALLPIGPGACGRSLPIFDGWSRYDVRLSAGGAPVTVAGVDAPFETCAVRWVPIAGHRADHPNVRRLAAETDLSVTFARLTGLPLRLPVAATAATPFGHAELRLEKIDAPAVSPSPQPNPGPGPEAGRKR
jgi:hypothetical protein